MDGQRNTATVKTAKTTFRILEELNEQEQATVTEIADEFDLSKSSIHNYLTTLEQDGYVIKDGDTYRIGLRLLNLGGRARHQKQIYQVSTEELTKLAEETGEMVNLLVEEQGRGIYLYRSHGELAVKSDSYIGHRVYLHNTALGHAILSKLPEERVNEIIDRHGLPKTTEKTITDRETLLQQLEEVREEGIAYDDEARLKGLRCVATPIVNNDEAVEGAISISGPKSRFQGERYREELPAKLKNAANVIELNINYT